MYPVSSAVSHPSPRPSPSGAPPHEASSRPGSTPEAAELTQLVLDSVPALVSYIDAGFRYRLANPTYRSWFGLEPEQIVGRTVQEVFGDAIWEAVRPSMERALGGEAVTFEQELTYRNGGPRWVRISYSPDRDAAGRVRGFAGLVNDWTQWAQTEVARRETERMLALSQRMAHVGSWVLELDDLADLDANRLRWTDESYRIFGFEPGSVEITNELFFSTIPPEDRAAIEAAVAQALRDRQPYPVQHRVRRPDGSERIVQEWAMIETDASGRPKRMLGTCQDVSDQRRAEAALRESDRRKDEFLAALAHELRNPLAPLRSGLEILGMPGVPEQALRRTRAMMTRQLDHVVRLVDDLLDVARIARGRIELRCERVPLQAVIAHALETAQPGIDAAGHELKVSLAPEPLEVDGDPVRLAQAIANLVQNAARYTSRAGHLEVTLERDGAEARVRVRDDGVGISPEALPHVFTMFFQADRTSSGRGGLGIGLTLVKSVAELHGGRVEARSAGLGLGSEFTLRLPLASCPTGAEQCASASPGAEPTVLRRVLIVDDNADAADSLAALLSLQGHRACVAHDGTSGLALARRERPDILFLDLGMPGLDGYEVARQLRADPATRDTFLVALTGWGQEQDRLQTTRAGFDRHFVKPIAPDVLRALLAGLR